jgi:phytoene dehydrogenase-like protein
VLEGADAVGGRVRTDIIDGFRCDRGFQVYLDAYPTACQIFDHKALDLRAFVPGAWVHAAGKFNKLMDPWRYPTSILDGALAKVGSIADKLRVGAMRSELQGKAGEIEAIYRRPEQTIEAALRARGFSDGMIDRFWRPFFGGITLDTSLQGSSRMMEFVFRCFSLGSATVPALGMEELPRQLLAGLPDGCVRVNCRVERVTPRAAGGYDVCLHGGSSIEAREVVVAVDGATKAKLLHAVPGIDPIARRGASRTWNSTVNLLFAIDGKPPVDEAILMLGGEDMRGVINAAVMSNVSPSYAPAGASLMSLTMIGPRSERGENLAMRAREQMEAWFGKASTKSWRLLKIYRIDRALPSQRPPWLTTQDWPAKIGPGVYQAGDETDTASIDGAIASGLRAARAIAGRDAAHA